MTKNEALAALAIKKKISHNYFRPHEYFFLSSPGYYQFEDGAVIDTKTFWNDRAHSGWNDGFSIWGE